MMAPDMHHPAISPPAHVPPADRRLPAGSTGFPITRDGVRLRFPEVRATHLRLTCALDTRDERVIDVQAADGRKIGSIVVAYACPYEIFELELNPADAAAIAADGCVLRLTQGPEALWVIGSMAGPGGAVLSPHLLTEQADDRWLACRDRLASFAGLHPFGWLWGCVAAGLEDLHRATGDDRYRLALQAQAARFWHDGGLDFDSTSGRHGTSFPNIEYTLPAAIMERVLGPGPGDAAIAFWEQRLRPDGLVQDGDLTTEGAFTIAWPMADLAASRADDRLRDRAIDQLRGRFRLLIADGCIHQRGNSTDRHLPDWARGVAWLLLGTVRTLATMPADQRPADVLADLREQCQRVAGLQDGTGLWSNFLGSPHPVDCSGSAGIAAAFALGVGAGLLEDGFLVHARRAHAALGDRLTADGLLTGCAQLNRGGEALQRSDYRVISQMGMGLAAQLDAVL
jgi:unsaturated rhamnogalacturonyl hydrolase